jgi:hypothetical protein
LHRTSGNDKQPVADRRIEQLPVSNEKLRSSVGQREREAVGGNDGPMSRRVQCTGSAARHFPLEVVFRLDSFEPMVIA